MASKFKDSIVFDDRYEDVRKLLTKDIFNYFEVDSDLKSFKIFKIDIKNCLFCIIFI